MKRFKHEENQDWRESRMKIIKKQEARETGEQRESIQYYQKLRK